MLTTLIPEKLTLEEAPSFLLFMAHELFDLKEKIGSTGSKFEDSVEKPIDITETSYFIGKEIPTIYTLCQKKQIPYHRKGKKLYFFKSELVQWIKTSNDNSINLESDFITANKKRSK